MNNTDFVDFSPMTEAELRDWAIEAQKTLAAQRVHITNLEHEIDVKDSTLATVRASHAQLRDQLARARTIYRDFANDITKSCLDALENAT